MHRRVIDGLRKPLKIKSPVDNSPNYLKIRQLSMATPQLRAYREFFLSSIGSTAVEQIT